VANERGNRWGATRVLLGLLAALVLAAIAAVLTTRTGATIEGIVLQNGRPVPGARVVLSVSFSNGGPVTSIPYFRPRERMVVADDEGHYVIENARTDIILGIFALPATGKGGVATMDVRAKPGETQRMNLQVPVRAAPR